MKISVVIPAHNEEKVIEGTLRAILSQDYDDFEVIVVANACTDKTAEVASKYSVKVVEEPRIGLLSAREAGRLVASGEIIANMDADCMPDKSWLSVGASKFRDQKIIAVTGPYIYYDGGAFFRYSSHLTQNIFYRIANALFQSALIRRGAIIIGGNNMIRAQVLEKCGGYDTSIIFYGEDVETARSISKFGKVVYCSDLPMKTSARRFKSQGFLKIVRNYWYHFLKSVSKGRV